MNKNKFILILMIAILVFAGGVVFLVLKPDVKEKSIPKETGLNVVKSNPQPVVYDGKLLTPDTLDLKKGEIVSVINNSSKKVMVEITNKSNPKLPHPILTVDLGKSASSSGLEADGVYVFSVLDISKIPVQSKDSTGSNYLGVTPLIAPFVEVTVSSSGISPSQVTAKKGGLIHFVNKTSRKIEIVSSGSLKIVVMSIEAGKTGISLPLFDLGNYSYSLKDDFNIKGTVSVR